MYDHPDYKDKDPEAISKFIETYPLAVLSGCDRGYHPVATQVPVLLEKEGDKQFLRGHMIKGATHHKAFAENPLVMLVFPGPQSYVSATWCAKKQSASTWNYMSVQATGEIRFLGEEALRAIMQKSTLHFEGGDSNSPTVFRNLDPAYVEHLMKYIIAFEVRVDSMDHVFKLSQDQDAGCYKSIIRELKKGDPNAKMVAGEMEKRFSGLFGQQE